MPRLKTPDYYPVRINMLETAVENIGIPEKSGVSDYTPFGMSMPERSWSLPDACNTYTSLYYDNMLDIDCWVDCGTWTTIGRGTSVTCNTNFGSMTVQTRSNNQGAYIEFNTEIDSIYVVKTYVLGYASNSSWQISACDDQGSIIESETITQTGEISFEFQAKTTISRFYILRTSGIDEKTINFNQLSVTGKYHKEDVMYLSYRYKFNGKELDPLGMGGGGSTYDYGFRIYNAQIARFLSVDPLTASYPWYTPYQFAGNKPIWAIDLDGLEELSNTEINSILNQISPVLNLAFDKSLNPDGTTTEYFGTLDKNYNASEPQAARKYSYSVIATNDMKGEYHTHRNPVKDLTEFNWGQGVPPTIHDFLTLFDDRDVEPSAGYLSIIEAGATRYIIQVDDARKMEEWCLWGNGGKAVKEINQVIKQARKSGDYSSVNNQIESILINNISSDEAGMYFYKTTDENKENVEQLTK